MSIDWSFINIYHKRRTRKNLRKFNSKELTACFNFVKINTIWTRLNLLIGKVRIFLHDYLNQSRFIIFLKFWIDVIANFMRFKLMGSIYYIISKFLNKFIFTVNLGSFSFWSSHYLFHTHSFNSIYLWFWNVIFVTYLSFC